MATITTATVLSMRANLAGYHLRSALGAAKSAYEIEQAHQNEEFGPWYEQLVVFVPTAVVMAAAALEAKANELIQDILDKPSLFSLSGDRIMDLNCLKRERTGNGMSRYREVGKICGKAPDAGSRIWQNSKLLIECRNEFMHFRPAWVSQSSDDDRDVVEELKNKVPLSTVFRGGSLIFPHSFMTYGFARWAVDTVLKLSAYFTTLLGVPDSFVQFGQDCTLP
jgi:hypothetical protein